MFGKIAFGFDHGYDIAYAEYGAVFTEHFLYYTINRTRHFNDGFVVLYLHDDIFICYFVPWLDMHFDDFTFMQAFAQFREPIFKLSHRKDLLFCSSI
ncbi:hypothetical protein D3C74_258310 [compost metagenome]